MPNIRERIEENEALLLSPYATLSKNSKGRLTPEPKCEIRTEFHRDRDRILHSKSFRRLKHKTQVFIAPKGDHYRTRLTHTLEVAQIARTIARALKMNEDLAEAIALGHDLGHTPFGHAGESVLRQLSPTGFNHYEQSVRIVSKLEKNGKGLNLTYEVIDGILHHTKGPQASSPEGKIVRICDRIAYINHDLEDALCAGVLNERSIPKKFKDAFGERPSQRINSMVSAVIKNSKDGNISVGEELSPVFEEIHDFMYASVYLNKQAFSEDDKVPFIISCLYDHFLKNINEIPKYLQQIADEESPEMAVCDYIASMSDQFATEAFKEIFIPKSLTPF